MEFIDSTNRMQFSHLRDAKQQLQAKLVLADGDLVIMATLKTNTLTGTSTAGSIAVTGEGNSTTTNLQQGLVNVWLI